MIVGIIVLANRGEQLSENAKSLIISQLIVVIPGLIASMFALAKSNQAAEKAAETAKKADEMHEDLKNGLIPAKVEEAITNLAADPENGTVTINHNGNSAA